MHGFFGLISRSKALRAGQFLAGAASHRRRAACDAAGVEQPEPGNVTQPMPEAAAPGTRPARATSSARVYWCDVLELAKEQLEILHVG